MKSTTVRIGLLVLAAVLTLTGLGGTVLASGDLFDDYYSDCPHKTRLRDGQISDLSVNRDSEEEDEINVSWAATDPATWGLGPNAYSTSLVVILDDNDGDPVSKKLSLGSRSTTFDEVDTGTEVTVQMAIVVDTADGDYLISDILEKSIHQSLTKPSFSTAWRQWTDVTLPTRTGKAEDFKIHSQAVAGMLYYVGYNENFGNYKSNDPKLATTPSTARLRIGLANTELDAEGNRYKSNAGPYDEVDFNAYIIRIVDEDGDVVSEGDDVATMESNYKSVVEVPLSLDHDGDSSHDSNGDGNNNDPTDTPNFILTAPTKLFLYPFEVEGPEFATADKPEDRTINGYALSNVRIVDGDDITVAAHDATELLGNRDHSFLSAPYLSRVKVDHFDLRAADVDVDASAPGVAPPQDAHYSIGTVDTVFAEPPNEHRDFPIDTFASDETYTISAWAVNDDDEVISPVVKLVVRPKDTARGNVRGFIDYNDKNFQEAPDIDGLTTTEFTVLK